MSRPTLLFTALKSDFKSFRYICDATCTNYNIVQIFPSNVLIIQKYSTNIPQIFFRYFTNIMVIIDKQQIKVEQWLDQKYWSNIFHYFRIIQIFLQMIYKYWTNIMKTMWKYSTVSILWKKHEYLANISRNCADIVQIFCKYSANIAIILYKYRHTLCTYFINIEQRVLEQYSDKSFSIMVC